MDNVGKGGSGRWADQQSGLDLSMAVGAYEDALLHFLLIRGERLCRLHAHRKGLRRSIHVVKREVDDRSVITANRATAAGFLYQDALDLLLSTRNRLADTSLASPASCSVSTAIQGKFGDAMALACPELNRALAGRIRWSPGVPEQRNRRFCSRPCHEHMFATTPDD
jgi:hypothetical protein